MRYYRYFVMGLLAAAPCVAFAQGFPGDVVPYPQNGQITIGGYDHYTAPPVASPLERVHLYDFAQDPSQPNFITDPGFDNLAGFPPLIPGQPLSFHLTTDLLYWNGTGGVSFAPAPSPTSLTLSLGSLSTVIDGDSVSGNFSVIQFADVNGRLHTHVGSTIDATAPEGIYMIGMTLHFPGFIDSKPFYVMYNDFQTLLSGSQSDFDTAEALGQEAAAWVQDHIDTLPEPSTLALAATALLALPLTMRRKVVTAAKRIGRNCRQVAAIPRLLSRRPPCDGF
jgi:hypothetical protein